MIAGRIGGEEFALLVPGTGIEAARRFAEAVRTGLAVAAADRIRTEYELPIAFQPTSLFTARWLEADDDRDLKSFLDSQEAAVADDVHGLPVFLAANAYRLKVAQEDWPKIRFLKTREQVV